MQQAIVSIVFTRVSLKENAWAFSVKALYADLFMKESSNIWIVYSKLISHPFGAHSCAEGSGDCVVQSVLEFLG